MDPSTIVLCGVGLVLGWKWDELDPFWKWIVLAVFLALVVANAVWLV